MSQFHSTAALNLSTNYQVLRDLVLDSLLQSQQAHIHSSLCFGTAIPVSAQRFQGKDGKIFDISVHRDNVIGTSPQDTEDTTRMDIAWAARGTRPQGVRAGECAVRVDRKSVV